MEINIRKWNVDKNKTYKLSIPADIDSVVLNDKKRLVKIQN